MKRTYLTGLFMIAGLWLGAQNKDTKKADEHFAEFEYVEAAEEYAELVEDGEATPYVYKRLAKTYFLLNNTRAAEKYYAIVVGQDTAEAQDYYNYAQVLKANGKYEEAQGVMGQFAQMAPNDPRAEAFRENPGYLKDIMAKEPGFTAEKMELNTEVSDFGARLFGGQLYFVSARNRSRREYGWNEQPTLDVYVAQETAGTFGNAELLPGEVNSKYHEGTVSITEDGQTMYFTRNDYFDGDYEADEEGIGQLKVYSAQWIANEWANIAPLPFNSSEYSTGHTALAPDGNTLYFSSDMPGGFGNSDIYKVAIQENGTFGEPQNLGAAINGMGRESFPFIGKDGVLYFSSDGHLGLGGLDIFYAEPQGDGFSAPKNMGSPVNSSKDDFAFTYYKAKKMAFVSSNRANAEANDNIYILKPIERCETNILVKVVDAETQAPISMATVDIYGPEGERMASVETSGGGSASLVQPCAVYEVQVNAEGYFSNSASTEAEKENQTLTIALDPEPVITETEVILEPIYFAFDKAEITPEAALELDRLVRVMEERPEMKIQVRAHTDYLGSETYNLALSERRAQSTVDYIIAQGIDASRISGKGFGETMPEIPCAPNCTDKQRQDNRRSEFKIVK